MGAEERHFDGDGQPHGYQAREILAGREETDV